LRAASDGNHPKMGILTVGEANAGKTRLALEAMIATLPDWDALIWLLGDRESKIPTAARLNGRNVAIFVDDVHAFAAGGDIASGGSGGDARSAQASVAGPAATLRTLYQHVCQEAAHVVVVATCRREEREFADGSLGWLFEKLDEVSVPTFNNDERSGEAQRIITEFSEKGEVRDEWNGTIGSLVLGLGRLHEEYVELDKRHSSGVPVLHAMKLLRLGGIPEMTGKRIRAVCGQILHETALAPQSRPWDDALAELDRVQFVFITPDDTGDTRLTIRKDDYFRYVVNDYPADYLREQHRAQLRDVFVALEDDDGLFFLGNGYYFDEEYSSAIAAYQEAIRLNPAYATAYYNMGTTLGKLQRYDEAIAAYQEAIRLNPTYATAYYNMGVALALSGKLEEALGACNRALTIDEQLVVGWKLKAAILRELGREDVAATAEERARHLEG
jgi:tetratricopeptide (TPR) repeat protein